MSGSSNTSNTSTSSSPGQRRAKAALVEVTPEVDRLILEQRGLRSDLRDAQEEVKMLQIALYDVDRLIKEKMKIWVGATAVRETRRRIKKHSAVKRGGRSAKKRCRT
jgi:hypothetical protein